MIGRIMLNRLIRLPLHLVPRGLTVPILTGALRGAKWITGQGTNGTWLGTYERPVQRLFCEVIKRGDVIFDAGANVGFFTLLAARLAGGEGHVYAFEPLPANLASIGRHLTLNQVSNVTILPVALGERAGSVRFSTSTHRSMGRVTETGEIEVTLSSINELMKSAVVRPPQVMKMDIEGSELAALRGASSILSLRPLTIILSTHGYEQHEACWSLLTEWGFTLLVLKDGATDGDYLILAK